MRDHHSTRTFHVYPSDCPHLLSLPLSSHCLDSSPFSSKTTLCRRLQPAVCAISILSQSYTVQVWFFFQVPVVFSGPPLSLCLSVSLSLCLSVCVYGGWINAYLPISQPRFPAPLNRDGFRLSERQRQTPGVMSSVLAVSFALVAHLSSQPPPLL